MLRIRKKRDEAPEPPLGGEILECVGAVSEESDENSEEGCSMISSVTGEIGETEEKSIEVKEEDPERDFSPEFGSEARAFAKGREIPDGQLEEGLSYVKKIGEAWIAGTPDVDMLEVVIRGLDFERAVTKARADGEVHGRNAQIEEKYMRPADSDGLPHLSGKGNVSRSGRNLSSIFDLARDAG